jgi:error-prone DNA polymerase
MNHHAGMYDKRTHLEDAKRRGVAIRLPDLNASGDGFLVEEGSLRTGLDRVHGLSEATRGAIGTERRRRPLAGLEDLLVRVRPSRAEAEALILAGALDFTRRHRSELLCVLATAYDRYRRRETTDGDELFAGPPRWPVPALREFSPEERIWLEWSVLEVCVGEHPMQLFRREGGLAGAVSCRDAETRPGRRVQVAGVLAARRTVPTRTGRRMQFLTLEDETGLVECMLFPEVYERHRGLVRELGPYLAEGRVEEEYGAPTLTVDRILRIPPPAGLAGVAARAAAVRGRG